MRRPGEVRRDTAQPRSWPLPRGCGLPEAPISTVDQGIDQGQRADLEGQSEAFTCTWVFGGSPLGPPWHRAFRQHHFCGGQRHVFERTSSTGRGVAVHCGVLGNADGEPGRAAGPGGAACPASSMRLRDPSSRHAVVGRPPSWMPLSGGIGQHPMAVTVA